MKFSIFLISTVIVASLGEKVDEKVDVIEGKIEKKDKRGLFGLGYAYGSSNYGTLGGYGLGSTIGSSYSPYHHALAYEAPLPHYPTSIHTTITKHVPVAVPHPVPVTVERHVPVPVAAPYPVEVPRPYPVEVPRPVPVTVERPYAVPVDRPYPVAVPQPVPVPVYKHIGVPVPHPVPVPVKTYPYISKEIYSHHAHAW